MTTEPFWLWDDGYDEGSGARMTDHQRRRLAEYRQSAERVVALGESHGYSLADRVAIALQSAYFDGLDEADR